MSNVEPWPLAPHAVVDSFLPQGDYAALLAWVLSSEPLFKPATITRRGSGAPSHVDASVRVALTTSSLGELRATLEPILLNALPQLMQLTGTSGAPPLSLELELAAHGDGAHYTMHTDIPVGAGRRSLGAQPGEDRILSAVLYLHGEPKAFSGGDLRLFRFGAAAEAEPPAPGTFVDIEPAGNRLVAFPSWAPHEVRPVRCRSGSFKDYRFALNCWYCRPL